MRDSLTPGLEGVAQHSDHLEAQISFHLIFFLWGYIKNIVSAEKIRNIHHLQDRITSAIETVTRDMIQKTWLEIEFRLDVSRATNGAHIEMYWGKSKTLNFCEHFKTPNAKIYRVLFKLQRFQIPSIFFGDPVQNSSRKACKEKKINWIAWCT